MRDNKLTLFLGAPEFESVLMLPRPSPSDRQNLFTTMIQHSGLILESLPRQDPESESIDQKQSELIHNENKPIIQGNEIEMKTKIKTNSCDISEHCTDSGLLSYGDNIIRWSLLLSRLTAGYLPGDLAGMVRRAAGITHEMLMIMMMMMMIMMMMMMITYTLLAYVVSYF